MKKLSDFVKLSIFSLLVPVFIESTISNCEAASIFDNPKTDVSAGSGLSSQDSQRLEEVIKKSGKVVLASVGKIETTLNSQKYPPSEYWVSKRISIGKASGRYGQEQKGYAYVYKLYGEDTQFILVSNPYSYECGHASHDDYHPQTCYGATYNYLGCPSGTKKYFTSNVDGKIYCLK